MDTSLPVECGMPRLYVLRRCLSSPQTETFSLTWYIDCQEDPWVFRLFMPLMLIFIGATIRRPLNITASVLSGADASLVAVIQLFTMFSALFVLYNPFSFFVTLDRSQMQIVWLLRVLGSSTFHCEICSKVRALVQILVGRRYISSFLVGLQPNPT